MSYPPSPGTPQPWGHPQQGQQPQGQQPGQQPWGHQPGQQPWGPPPLTSEPTTIRGARWASWVGAVICVVYPVARGLEMRLLDDPDWRELEVSAGDSADGLFLALIGGGVLVSLLLGLLWVLLTHAATRGKDWARIVGTVLFAITAVCSLCGAFFPPIVPSAVLDVGLVVAGAATVACLWAPASSQWIRQQASSY